MIAELHFISAIMAFFSSLLIYRGFAPLAKWRATDAVSAMAMGISLTSMAIMLRIVYWGVIGITIETIAPEAWAKWIQWTGGQRVNMLFNFTMVLSTHYVLMALWLLIPAHDRNDWTFLSAPFYPNKRNMVVRVLSYMAQTNAVRKQSIEPDETDNDHEPKEK